jgi:hypothetical protein
MDKFFLNAMWIMFGTWLLISPFFWVYWFFYPKALSHFSVKHKNICWVIGIGAFLGCWVAIGGGLERILWFVPADWGYHNEEGEFRLIRNSVAGIISFFMAFFIAYLFAEVRTLCREVLKKENQIERAGWKDKFKRMEKGALEEKATEFKQDVEKLHELSCKVGLTIEQEEELNLLHELLYDLEEEINRKEKRRKSLND